MTFDIEKITALPAAANYNLKNVSRGMMQIYSRTL